MNSDCAENPLAVDRLEISVEDGLRRLVSKEGGQYGGTRVGGFCNSDWLCGTSETRRTSEHSVHHQWEKLHLAMPDMPNTRKSPSLKISAHWPETRPSEFKKEEYTCKARCEGANNERVVEIKGGEGFGGGAEGGRDASPAGFIGDFRAANSTPHRGKKKCTRDGVWTNDREENWWTSFWSDKSSLAWDLRTKNFVWSLSTSPSPLMRLSWESEWSLTSTTLNLDGC